MRFLTLFLSLSLYLQGAVSILTVRTSGGDYAGTLAGLQSAVNAAASSSSTDPIVIDIEAGVTYSNAVTCYLTIPVQTNATKPIVLRSSRIGELPINTRVSPSDASKMPLIQNNCTSSVSPILVLSGASHYIFEGLEVYYSGLGRNALGTIGIGYTSGGNKVNYEADWAHSIIVDRCWLHGVDTTTWVTAATDHANQQGITLQGRNLTVKNTYISDTNMDAVDHGQGESRGVSSDNGSVLFIFNNRLPGSIGSITGGDYNPIPGLLITHTRYFGNEYNPDPESIHWEEWDTGDTLDTAQACITGAFFQQKVSPFDKWECIAGVWTPSATTRTNRSWVKNAWECKNCRDVLVEGNYLYNIAQTGDQSQRGHCFLMNLVDPFFSAFHARPEFIKIRFNRCENIGQGLVTSWYGNSSTAYGLTRDIYFEHNILTGLMSNLINPTQDTNLFTDPAGGNEGYSTGVKSHLIIRKNTFLYDRTFGGATFSLNDADDFGFTKNVIIQDSIFGWASVGFRGSNSSTETCTFFNSLLGAGSIWNNIGLIDTNSRGSAAFSSIYGQPGCPSAILRQATQADVKFADVGADDFRLCTGPNVPVTGCTASPWALSASDGGPLGADSPQVAYATSGVSTGTADYPFYYFQIRRADEGEIRYTAYSIAACTGTIKDSGGSTIDSWTDAGGASLDRTHTPAALSIGEYTTRVTCESRWKEASFIAY